MTMAKTLTSHIEERLREAIHSARFAVGTYLPSRASLAAEFGVSEFVVRAALTRLSADGLLAGYQGRGYKVLTYPARPASAFILDVNVEPWYSFGPCVSLFSCAKALRSGGCRVFSLPLAGGDRKEPYLLPLKKALKERPDLVILRSCSTRRTNAQKILEDSGCRFVTVGMKNVRRRGSRHIGNFEYDYARAINALAADCVRKSTRTVLQVDFGDDSYCDASETLASCGIAVERLSRAITGPRDLDQIVRDAYSSVKRRLREGPLPDLVLLTDDYLAEGAFEALRDCGISFPGDLKVVSYSNARSGLVQWRDVACIEFDPHADGLAIAASVMAWVETGVLAPYACPAVYRPGASFEYR